MQSSRIWTRVTMASCDDCCRFCDTNLRIKGVLTNTKLIFEQRQATNEKTLHARLLDLGCNIIQERSKSSRMCRSCFRQLERIEGGIAILEKWKAAEEDIMGKEASSVKRQREFTPSKTPRSVKKQRPKPLTPTQSSETTSCRLSRPSTEMPLRQTLTEVSKNCSGLIEIQC